MPQLRRSFSQKNRSTSISKLDEISSTTQQPTPNSNSAARVSKSTTSEQPAKIASTASNMRFHLKLFMPLSCSSTWPGLPPSQSPMPRLREKDLLRAFPAKQPSPQTPAENHNPAYYAPVPRDVSQEQQAPSLKVNRLRAIIHALV